MSKQEEFFDQLYDSYFQSLWVQAKAAVSNPLLAEEIVQDAYVEALLRIDDLMGYERPDLWLRKTVKYKCFHVMSALTRNNRLMDALANEEKVNPRITTKEMDEVEESQRERVERIKQKTARILKQEELYLLNRTVLEQATYKEMSSELGVTLSAVKKRISRIRKKLQGHFPGW